MHMKQAKRIVVDPSMVIKLERSERGGPSLFSPHLLWPPASGKCQVPRAADFADVGGAKIPPFPTSILQELAADFSIEEWEFAAPSPPPFDPPIIAWDGQKATPVPDVLEVSPAGEKNPWGLPVTRSQPPPEPPAPANDSMSTSAALPVVPSTCQVVEVSVCADEIYHCTGRCGRAWTLVDEVPFWSRSKKKRKPWCNVCGADQAGWWNDHTAQWQLTVTNY